MTRRILAALVGLTAVLLAGVVVPLGIFTSRHDEQVFVDRAVATASGVATAAEERIADPKENRGNAGAPVFTGGVSGNGGDRISVYDIGGQPVAGTPQDVTLAAADRAAATAGQTRIRWTDHPDRLLVVVPVTSSGHVVGAAALSRSAGPLNAERERLWAGLTLVGAAALAAAAALSFALARWVNRPMRRLEAAASRLGEGTLSARARADDGPAELKQLAETFNSMAGRLETLLASQRNVIADVSHQLRTPLAALRLRLELLRQDAEGAAGADLDGTLSEVSRLSHLVDGMLAVARAENTNPTPKVIDVGAIARGRAEAWAPVAADTQVSLEVSAADASAMATPGHLEQILDNLLANAIDATPVGGHITVGVTRRGGRVSVSVVDSGPGMSPSQRANALRRFWTEQPSRPDGPGDRHGSGLGLAIADRLASVDEGHLTLDDAPGGGLLAVVDLPAAVT